MKKSDTELFAQDVEPTFPESSRIDIIGQNGNTGEHYPTNKFAVQSKFGYGWDYIGFDDEDGLRLVFTSKEQADLDILEIIAFTDEDPKEYRTVPYNPNEDDTFARF